MDSKEVTAFLMENGKRNNELLEKHKAEVEREWPPDFRDYPNKQAFLKAEGLARPQWMRGLPRRVVTCLMSQGVTTAQGACDLFNHGQICKIRNFGMKSHLQLKNHLHRQGLRPFETERSKMLRAIKDLVDKLGYVPELAEPFIKS